jgi:ADP-ribosylglycohydrolase
LIPQEEEDRIIEEKAMGSILGATVGNAMGAPLMYKNLSEIDP